jgi:quinol monooxygenase YgiN
MLLLLLVAGSAANAQEKDMIVRISEIQIHPNSIAEYKAILKEEAEASVRLEPGVIAIFPMSHKENPTKVKILEIYASREAYEAHLKTRHFQKYKTTTLEMVKSLKLVDMDALDAQTMARIFKKMQKSD